MPIKEFQCKDCGHIVEELVRYPGDEPTECPHCQTDTLRVLPSAIGGYGIKGSNGASTRPRFAGSFNGKPIEERFKGNLAQYAVDPDFDGEGGQ